MGFRRASRTPASAAGALAVAIWVRRVAIDHEAFATLAPAFLLGARIRAIRGDVAARTSGACSCARSLQQGSVPLEVCHRA